MNVLLCGNVSNPACSVEYLKAVAKHLIHNLTHWVIYFSTYNIGRIYIIIYNIEFHSSHAPQQSSSEASFSSSSSCDDLWNCLSLCWKVRGTKEAEDCKENCPPAPHPSLSPRASSLQGGKGDSCWYLLGSPSYQQAHELLPCPSLATHCCQEISIFGLGSKTANRCSLVEPCQQPIGPKRDRKEDGIFFSHLPLHNTTYRFLGSVVGNHDHMTEANHCNAAATTTLQINCMKILEDSLGVIGPGFGMHSLI